MKKTFVTMCLLLACSVALAAAQSQDQDQQNTPPSSSSQMGKNVTLTGCLEQGTEPNSFVLNNVNMSELNQQSQYQRRSDQSQDQNIPDQSQAQSNEPDQNQAQDQSGYESQSGSMPSELARTETSINVIPEGNLDLSSHVGQRVQVTGKISETTTRTNQSSRATTPSGQSSEMHSSTQMSGQHQLQATSIRQISGSCQ